MEVGQDLPPTNSGLRPVVVESGKDLDAFVTDLAKDMRSDLDAREVREEQWEKSLKQYKARLKSKKGRQSNIDSTITREKCIQAKSRVINPIIAYDSIATAKAQSIKYKKHVPVYQRIVDWMIERADLLPFMDKDLEQAQIYPCSVAKIINQEEKCTVKYWKKSQQPIFNEYGEEIAQQEVTEIAEKEYIRGHGYKMVNIDRIDVLFPEHSESVDSARYFAHRYRPYKQDILRNKDNYRKDLTKIFGKKLERLCNQELKNEEQWRDFSTRYDVEKTGEHETRDDPKREIQIWEVYTWYDGQEVIINLDITTGLYLSAIYNYHFDFPRPFSTFAWYQAIGDIDGSSLCQILEPGHRVLRAITNQELDVGSRGLEKVVFIPPGTGLPKFFKDNQLQTGIYEVMNPDAIEKIKEFSLSSNFTRLPEIIQEIKQSIDNVSSVADAFYGNEVASRPTATGTTSVIEEAKQPLFTLVERYRLHLQRVLEILFARYRQEYPESIEVYADGQTEQNQERVEEMIQWPDGYWRDHIAIETRVSSQQMNKTMRKQEVLALVQALPAQIQIILELSDRASDPASPQAPIAKQMLGLFTETLKTYFEEFEVENGEMLNVEQGINLSQQMYAFLAKAQEEEGMGPAGPVPGGPPGIGSQGNGASQGTAGMAGGSLAPGNANTAEVA